MTPSLRKDEFGKPIACQQCDAPQHHHKAGIGKRALTWITCSPDCPENQADPRDTPKIQTASTLKKSRCSRRGTKAKGDGEERAICKWAEGQGFNAYRTAGSGAHGTRNNESAFSTDVRLSIGPSVFKVESKRHASVSGLKSQLRMIDGSDLLWMREDHGKPWVLLEATTLAAMLEAARQSKREA